MPARKIPGGVYERARDLAHKIAKIDANAALDHPALDFSCAEATGSRRIFGLRNAASSPGLEALYARLGQIEEAHVVVVTLQKEPSG
jgi:hypothetical protein